MSNLNVSRTVGNVTVSISGINAVVRVGAVTVKSTRAQFVNRAAGTLLAQSDRDFRQSAAMVIEDMGD